MIPNKFVILWNDTPIRIMKPFPIAPYPMKVTNPNEIQWFENRTLAEHWVSQFSDRGLMIVKEIQFRIMNE